MACHETALEAIYEDSLSDSSFEEGELNESEVRAVGCHTMDVDSPEVHCETTGVTEVVRDKVSNGSAAPAFRYGESTEYKDGTCPAQKKKPKRKRSGKKQLNGVNVAKFVREACNRLQEKKYPLVWAAVKSLGVERVSSLLKEVDAIEKCGGQLTNDGKRRRTPGGVMWNILRDRVQPDVYKEIMSKGNEAQKLKIKEAKESRKRNRMDVDEPVSYKRQKLNLNDSKAPAHDKQGRQPNPWSQPVNKSLDVIDIPQRDDLLLPATQLQQAWAAGIRKKEISDVSCAVSVSSPEVDLRIETLNSVPVEKKSVLLHERLRVPVQYSDLVRNTVSSYQRHNDPMQSGDHSQGTLLENQVRQDCEQEGD